MQPVVVVWESVSHRRQTPAERAEPMLVISPDEEEEETLQLLMEILQSRSVMYYVWEFRQKKSWLLAAMQRYRN